MFDELRASEYLASLVHNPLSMCTVEQYVGGLSKPSKMPWYAYNLPAAMCIMGSKLRHIRGSVCSKCYARKGRYVFPNVRAAMDRRHYEVTHRPEQWAANMIHLLQRKARGKEQWFRWHDSGDLQGIEHLDAIIWIAQNVSNVRFWLPTKEYVTALKRRAIIHKTSNLTVRVSAYMIGDVKTRCLFPTSSVNAGTISGYRCPAKSQGNICGDCRACWDRDVGNIDYPLH